VLSFPSFTLLLVFKLLDTGKTCEALDPPANGKVRSLLLESGDAHMNGSIVLQYGHQVDVDCDVGFQLQGASILTCLEDGRWDDAIPFCHPIGCKNPPL
jgi:hypothetical protein